MPGIEPDPRRGPRRAPRCSTSTSYDVDARPHDRRRRPSASTTVGASAAREPGAATFVDLVAAERPRDHAERRGARPGAAFDGARIALTGLAADNELRVVADCAYSHTGEGLHRFVDPVDERGLPLHPVRGRRRAPGVRRASTSPTSRRRSRFTVTAPARLAGRLQRADARARGAARRRASRRGRFAPTAADVDVHHRARRRAVPRGARRATSGRRLDDPAGRATAARRWPSTSTPTSSSRSPSRASSSSSEQFGMPYPFTKYDQLFVPEFNAGAMENAGCVTFHEDYFVFRSKVTDAAARAARQHDPARDGAHVVRRPGDHALVGRPVAQRVVRRVHGLPLAPPRPPGSRDGVDDLRDADARPGATARTSCPRRTRSPPTPRDLETAKANFDGITYAKGASVLHQLVAWVGVEEFMAGLRAYFAKHAWGNTTLADLLAELEETSGRDLTAWSKEWLETAGCNTLRPESELDADGTYQQLAVAAGRTRRPPDAALAPDRDRPLRPRRASAWSAAAASRSTSRARGPRSPSSSASASPTCCCSTTTT